MYAHEHTSRVVGDPLCNNQVTYTNFLTHIPTSFYHSVSSLTVTGNQALIPLGLDLWEIAAAFKHNKNAF